MRIIYFLLVAFYPFLINAQDPFAGQMASFIQLRNEGKVIEAKKAFETFAIANPTYVPARLEWAVSASFLGEFREALILYNQILSENPQNEFAWVGKIRTLFWAQLFTETAKEIQQALLVYPQQTELLGLRDKLASVYKTEIAAGFSTLQYGDNSIRQKDMTLHHPIGNTSTLALNVQRFDGAFSAMNYGVGWTVRQSRYNVGLQLNKAANGMILEGISTIKTKRGAITGVLASGKVLKKAVIAYQAQPFKHHDIFIAVTSTTIHQQNIRQVMGQTTQRLTHKLTISGSYQYTWGTSEPHFTKLRLGYNTKWASFEVVRGINREVQLWEVQLRCSLPNNR